jgi:NADH-quinone oxidoreductase subunit N
MTLAAFFVLSIVRVQTDSDQIDALDGLAKRNPLLAIAITVIMASLAGVPLTVGFLGKLFVFRAAVDAGMHTSVMIAAITAAAGFYYYFKILRAVWWNAPHERITLSLRGSSIFTFALALLTVAIVVFGFYPQPLLQLIR